MAQRKLEKTPEENRKTVDLVSLSLTKSKTVDTLGRQISDKDLRGTQLTGQMKEIGEIELSIQGGTEEIEALGEAGKVEESMEKLSAVEALKGLTGEKEKELQNLNETAGASGHQKLRVCETCVSALGAATLYSAQGMG